jgi:hypothetical protein
MTELTNKQHRTIDYQLRTIFSVKGLEASSMQAAKRLGLVYLHRELHLKDGRRVLLTDEGQASFSAILKIVQTSDGLDCSERSDIAGSLKSVLVDLISDGLMPENSRELITLLRARLSKLRARYWFAVPIHGVELLNLQSLRLGEFILAEPTSDLFAELGAKQQVDLGAADCVGRGPCLIGSVFGTQDFAKREFRLRAELVIGIISAVAAMSYEAGAAPFRITLEMSPEGAHSAARYVFWPEETGDVAHVRHWSDHQALRIDPELARYLEDTPYLRHAFAMTQRGDLSSLEQDILRGFFWYSDAQRDTVRVMQLIKYWSCAEAIFSGDGEAITKSVSEGVAGILVFGGFEFKRVDEYQNIVKTLSSIYGKRSKAVHGAHHDHVTRADISVLSQWTGYLLLGLLALVVEHGYTESIEVKAQTTRLAGVITRAKFRMSALGGDGSPNGKED